MGRVTLGAPAGAPACSPHGAPAGAPASRPASPPPASPPPACSPRPPRGHFRLPLLAVAILAAACAAPDSEPPAEDDAPAAADAAPANPDADAGAPAGYPDRFGFGREATHEEITAWDIDVMPDGTGLPAGDGTHGDGTPLYLRHCASCHGRTGEGGSAEPLVGYEPETAPPFGPRYEEWRGDGDDVPFTVGNYWPYATTLFDYIRRAMPSSAPGTLSSDEVYALTAWLLAENGIIETDAAMNATTLPQVQMPARDVFVPQERQP